MLLRKKDVSKDLEACRLATKPPGIWGANCGYNLLVVIPKHFPVGSLHDWGFCCTPPVIPQAGDYVVTSW